MVSRVPESVTVTAAELEAVLTCTVPPDWSASAEPGCLCVHNTDGDGDIDLQDFAGFQRAFGG